MRVSSRSPFLLCLLSFPALPADSVFYPVTLGPASVKAAPAPQVAKVATPIAQPVPVFTPAPAVIAVKSEPEVVVKVRDGSMPRAAQGSDYSLDMAISDAVKFHPTIKRALQEYQQNREAIDEAQAGYLPSLAVGVKSGFEQNEYSGENEKSSKATVSLNQLLYDFGKTSSRVGLAEKTAGRFQSEALRVVNDTVYQATTAWVQIAKYHQLVTIAVAQISGFEKINDLAKQRAALGASAQSDYSQSKVRLATAVSQRHEYEAQLLKWEATLQNLTNSDGAKRVPSEFPAMKEASCRNIDVDSITSPRVEAAQKQVDMARDQVSYSKAEYFPTISVAPTYEYRLQDENTVNNSGVKKGTFGVFLNVSAPLYEGGATSSRVRQSSSALYAAQSNLDAEKLDAKTKILEAASQIDSISYSLDAMKTRETEAIRTRDLYMLQYVNLGNRSFSDLISAESEIHQTRINIVNDSFTVVTANVECVYQSGNILKEYNFNLDN